VKGLLRVPTAFYRDVASAAGRDLEEWRRWSTEGSFPAWIDVKRERLPEYIAAIEEDGTW